MLLSSLLALSGLANGAAVITIVNGNAPGVGFNDPTPAAPLPTNPGTTLGEQRLIAFQYAAQLWGNTLDSIPEIRVLATFEPLTCTATAAVLGSAGPVTVSSDFPGALIPDTWYHAALANKLAGAVLEPTFPELRARFNVNLGTPGCLTASGWYLGRDTAGPANLINLVTVLLHEFAHGLGFSSVTNVSTGELLGGQSDAYSKFYFDTSLNLARDQMTQAQRQASAISGKVIWNGPNVTAAVPDVLDPGTPLLRVTAPASIAGVYAVGPASFGPPLASPGVTGNLVAALDPADAAGPSTFDACSPITNAAAVAGKVALVDRGTCAFVVKVKNVQTAGAIAAVVADNAPGSPPAGLGGTDPTITIPSVRVTQADGSTLRTALGSGTVTVTLGVDLTILAGANPSGFALLNSPNPVQPGSSISHWSPIAFPNQLMEPAINADLTHSVKPPQDLTLPLMRDIGWYPDGDLDLVPDTADQCLASDLAPTVIIGGIDTGIANALFTTGCTIKDLVNNCAANAKNHGAFVSCTTQLGNDLVRASILTPSEKGLLTSAAARAK
jgi:hypothetical protein